MADPVRFFLGRLDPGPIREGLIRSNYGVGTVSRLELVSPVGLGRDMPIGPGVFPLYRLGADLLAIDMALAVCLCLRSRQAPLPRNASVNGALRELAAGLFASETQGGPVTGLARLQS